MARKKTVCCGARVRVVIDGRPLDHGHYCHECEGVSVAALADGEVVPKRPRDPRGQDGALTAYHRFADRLKVVS